jgi:hypothetical protein
MTVRIGNSGDGIVLRVRIMMDGNEGTAGCCGLQDVPSSSPPFHHGFTQPVDRQLKPVYEETEFILSTASTSEVYLTTFFGNSDCTASNEKIISKG